MISLPHGYFFSTLYSFRWFPLTRISVSLYKNAYSWEKYQYKYTLKCKLFVFCFECKDVQWLKLNEHMLMNMIKLFRKCVLANSIDHLFNAVEISPQSSLINIIPTKSDSCNPQSEFQSPENPLPSWNGLKIRILVDFSLKNSPCLHVIKYSLQRGLFPNKTIHSPTKSLLFKQFSVTMKPGPDQTMV